MKHSSFFLSAFVGATGTFAAVVNYNFDIENTEVSPDGFTRASITSNGIFPGTPIYAMKGDTLHVVVNNQLTDPTMRRSTSIHWHGLTQHRNNYNDGPAFVTQCPIGPRSAYTYSMELPDAGTYWYHSHLGSQYLDGLRGPIIVYDPNDPHMSLYDVDDESTVIMLDDWFHTPAEEVMHDFMSTANTAQNEAVPDSGLINGKGRYVGGPAVPWSVINVEPNTRYRFRLINQSAIARYRFAIQGHTLTFIEADGISHVPITGNYIDIYPGQRYSVIVETNQATENYWVSAPMTVRSSGTNPNLDVNMVYAVLHYDGAANVDPSGTPPTPSGTAIVEANMAPLVNPGNTGSAPPDKAFYFRFTRQMTDTGVNFWVNGSQYIPPSLPTLLQVLSGANEDADFAVSENSYVIERDDIVEINIAGAPGHPFHLHGHSFDVVQSATGAKNYVNPPRRDVVATQGNNYVTIRFRADNPGPWIVHCHIDAHLEAGLAFVIVEAPSDTISGDEAVVPPPEWEGLCDAYNALDPSEQ